MDDERGRADATAGDARGGQGRARDATAPESPSADLAEALRPAEGMAGEVPALGNEPRTEVEPAGSDRGGMGAAGGEVMADPDVAAAAVPLPDDGDAEDQPEGSVAAADAEGEPDAAEGTDGVGTTFQPSYADYTTAELLEQAQGNAQALLLATVGFLRERGIPVEEWAAALGRRFARAWGEPQPWDADEFLDAMLTNFRSLGAVVVSANLGSDRAEAVTTGFPDPEHCELFGVDRAEAAVFNGAAAAIAADRGLDWSWELDGERTRFVASRRTG